MPANALIGNPCEDQIKASLSRLTNRPAKKEFTFVVSELAKNQMQECLTKFDEQRLSLGGGLFGFIISGADAPNFVKVIAKML